MAILKDEIDKLFMEKFGSNIKLNDEIILSDESTLIGIYEIQVLMPSNESIIYFFDLRNGKLICGHGTPSNKCDCRIIMSANDFIQFLKGQLEFAQGFLQGKIRVGHGTQASAFKFLHLLINIKSSSSSSSSTSAINTTKSIKTIVDGLKSDVIFTIIEKHIRNDPNLIQKMQFIIKINLTKNKNLIATWIINTKINGGQFIRYKHNNDNDINNNDDDIVKPDATITIDDDDLVSIMLGKLNPQRVFITGKMKIQGNVMLLQRLNQLWKNVQTSRKDPDFPFIKQLLLESELEPDLESEMVFFHWISRLIEPSNQLDNCSIHLIITNNEIKRIEWVIIYDSNNKLLSIKRQNLNDNRRQENNVNNGETIKLIMDDQDFCRLVKCSDQNQIQSIVKERVRIMNGNDRLLYAVINLFVGQIIIDNDQQQQQQNKKIKTPVVNLKAKL